MPFQLLKRKRIHQTRSPAISAPIDSVDTDLTTTSRYRRISEEVLAQVCAILNDCRRSPSHKTPCDGDVIIQKTLLSVQLLNKAGWRAATPFLWRTVTFRTDEDYTSFFLPFQRLRLNPPKARKPDGTRRSRILSLADLKTSIDRRSLLPVFQRLWKNIPWDRVDNDKVQRILTAIRSNAALPADVARFFTAAKWIQQVVISSYPPLTTVADQRLANNIPYEMDGDRKCFRGGIRLFLSGAVCPPEGETEEDVNKARLLGWFAMDIDPTEIAVFDIPGRGFDGMWTFYLEPKRFWKQFETLCEQYRWSDLPLTFLDVQPGQLSEISVGHPSTTISLSSRAIWAATPAWVQPPDPEWWFAHELGVFIMYRMFKKDPLLAETTIRIKGWLGCPHQPCSDHPYRRDGELMEAIIEQAIRALSDEDHFDMFLDDDDDDDPQAVARVDVALRKAVAENRLQICSSPCADHEAGTRRARSPALEEHMEA